MVRRRTIGPITNMKNATTRNIATPAIQAVRLSLKAIEFLRVVN
jgi:hypothetical protein